MPVRTKIFAYSFIIVGILGIVLGFSQWRSADAARFAILLVLGMLSSKMRFKIPRAEGTVTAGMIVVLIAIVELSPAEALAIALACAAVQIFWKRGPRASVLQVAFNLAGFGISVMATATLYSYLSQAHPALTAPLILSLVGLTYFGLNTVPVAIIISLTETGGEGPDWLGEYGWMALFYVSSSCLAGVLHLITTNYGWQAELLAFPVLLMAGRTYQAFIGRIEDGQKHTDELQALQFRSIHTLALAVEAKDENTNAHLHRVRSYANALGRELGLKGDELKALDAAAILHDIGKLAVPEHIIAKPGKLTPEEFDRMKIHTVVGATIVEEMEFPYPVAPLVRGHHEKWDGSGYPDGLAGEAIPLGARILSAVDCLDAMASDRPYRRAMPLEKAMSIVRSEAGKAYDPLVVEVLDRNHVALEAAARASLGTSKNAITANVQVSRGEAPATGFEVSAPATAGPQAIGLDPLVKLQAALTAQNAAATLAEAPPGTYSASDLVPRLSAILQPLAPHDALVLFRLSEDGRLVACGSHGHDADLLGQLSVPLRQGLAGWVAHHGESIVNGDPGVEFGAERWPRSTDLRAALATHLHHANRTVGVIGIYRREKDSFSRSELGMLDLLTPRIGECLAASIQLDPGASSSPPAAILSTAPAPTFVLARLALDGTPAPETLEACKRSIRECLPAGALFLELRPQQIAILSKGASSDAVLTQCLQEAIHKTWERHQVRVAAGVAYFGPGAGLETAVAEAERGLNAGGLIGLHNSVTPAATPALLTRAS